MQKIQIVVPGSKVQVALLMGLQEVTWSNDASTVNAGSFLLD